MRKMKSLVLAVMGLLCCMSVSAQDFAVNGIYYNITSQADKTVAVTYLGDYYNSYDNEYSGEVKIPESVTYNGHTYSVTSIGECAFSNCWGLTSVEIPNSVTSIGSSAFLYCSSLTSVEIPNSVTSIGDYAFYGTAWYNNQPDGVIYAGKVLYMYKGTMSANTSITIEDGTVSISLRAFYGCSSLTSVELPNSVTSIGDAAFYGCSSLTSVEIGNSVTSIGSSAFRYCSSLTSVELPNSVTSIGECAFYECSSLTVEIPNSVTSIGDYAFYGTAWYNNQPDGVIYAGKVLYMYKGTMSANTSITIEDGTVSISPRAFYGCSSLTSVEIPNSVTSIGDYVFYNCSSLTVEIPNSVTSIGFSAFYGCSRLTNIVLGSSVNSVGSNAFVDSPLRTIVSRNGNPATLIGGSSIFSNYTYIHAPLYVPEGAYWNYAYATGWGDFIHIKEIAIAASSLQSRKAYMIADNMGCNYQVYDAQKDAMKTVEYTHSLDEESEDCCWTVITENGKTYLYNLGAKKFGVVNDEGALTLSETPVNVTISENENGLSINGANCMFVLNKNVEVEITGVNNVLLNGADTKNAQIHSLDGRRQTHVTRGINIVNGKKVLVK